MCISDKDYILDEIMCRDKIDFYRKIFACSSIDLGWSQPWSILRGIITNTMEAKRRTRVSNMGVWIGFPFQPGCILTLWKYKTLLDWKTYHIIYQDDGLVMFKGKRSAQAIKMVIRVSANSGKVGGQKTPLVHCGNMDKWNGHYPICK